MYSLANFLSVFLLGFIFGCITGLISKNAIIIEIAKEKEEKK